MRADQFCGTFDRFPPNSMILRRVQPISREIDQFWGDVDQCRANLGRFIILTYSERFRPLFGSTHFAQQRPIFEASSTNFGHFCQICLDLALAMYRAKMFRGQILRRQVQAPYRGAKLQMQAQDHTSTSLGGILTVCSPVPQGGKLWGSSIRSRSGGRSIRPEVRSGVAAKSRARVGVTRLGF